MSFGCILAGGKSTRMGQDKVLLPWRGVPLVAHAAHLLRAAGLEPLVAGSRDDLSGYGTALPDHHPGSGPLAGIHAALLHAAATQGDVPVLFLAVDLPSLPPSFLRLLLERAERTGALVTVPFAGGAPQPLCAVYRASLAGAVGTALAAGDRKIMRVMRSLASPAQCDLPCVEAVIAARGQTPGEPPPHRWFLNLNTPEDLRRATLSQA